MTAAVPDPRFRDQLVKRLSWYTPIPEGIADDIEALVAAEVEARVQAAANQRAEAAARPGPAIIALAWHDVVCPESWECRDRVLHAAAQTVANTGHLAAFLDRLAALASPAPAPRAEEGQ